MPKSPLKYKVGVFVGLIAIALFIGFRYIQSASEDARGKEQGVVTFVFSPGTDALALASALRDAGIIRNEPAFLYRLFKERAWKKLQAGEYRLSGTMTIPEIINKLASGETVQKGVKVTFPEGFTAFDMARRLSEKGLPGDEFLKLVEAPPAALRKQFAFLSKLPETASLEGVLFPDTYFFSQEAGADGILLKMLENFEKQEKKIETFARASDAEWYRLLILASMLEAEVRSEEDRRLVADIFLRRLNMGMPLQSDATVKYVLEEKKIQHSLDDIAIDSAYNTYKYKGLPPGPISNPGLSSIRSAVFPEPNSYVYFLNNPETGQTVFAVTFEEHVKNKLENGL